MQAPVAVRCFTNCYTLPLPLPFYNHRPIFTTLGEMTDADKVTNPQHFGSDPPDPNPDHFLLRLDALAEVCALRAQSIVKYVNMVFSL